VSNCMHKSSNESPVIDVLRKTPLRPRSSGE